MHAVTRVVWLCPLLTLGCMNFRAVKDHELTVPVPGGFVQTFRAEVPLHPTLPTRMLISFTTRCRPDFSLSLANGRVRHSMTLFRQADPDPEWQALLRRRLTETSAQSTPASAASLPARPAPPAAAQPSEAETLRASGPGLTVSVELPREPAPSPSASPSFHELFEKKRVAVCGSETTWSWESSLLGPKVPQTILELSASVPQWVDGASLRIEIERLEPPESPQEPAPGPPPVVGAKWIPGQWIWKPEDEWVGNWAWFPGWWQRPSR